ncbi:MAG: hypothetical protein ACOX3W_01090 [Christensenellaceae bacterium]|jgi:preprotein translocase subunit SecF
MVAKRLKRGIVITVLIVLVSILFLFLSPSAGLGLDFTNGYLLKITIGEDFSQKEIEEILLPMQKECGDIRVVSAGEGDVAQVYIETQKMDEAIQEKIETAVLEKYNNATIGAAEKEIRKENIVTLLGYVGMALLGVLAASIYLYFRRGLGGSLGFLISAILALLLGGALLIITSVPIGIVSLMSMMMASIISAALYFIMLSQDIIQEEIVVEDEDAEEEIKKEKFVYVNWKPVLVTCVAMVVFSVGLFFLGGYMLQRFAVSLLIGLLSALFTVAYIGVPFYTQKQNAKLRLPSRKK